MTLAYRAERWMFCSDLNQEFFMAKRRTPIKPVPEASTMALATAPAMQMTEQLLGPVSLTGNVHVSGDHNRVIELSINQMYDQCTQARKVLTEQLANARTMVAKLTAELNELGKTHAHGVLFADALAMATELHARVVAFSGKYPVPVVREPAKPSRSSQVRRDEPFVKADYGAVTKIDNRYYVPVSVSLGGIEGATLPVSSLYVPLTGSAVEAIDKQIKHHVDLAADIQKRIETIKDTMDSLPRLRSEVDGRISRSLLQQSDAGRQLTDQIDSIFAPLANRLAELSAVPKIESQPE